MIAFFVYSNNSYLDSFFISSRAFESWSGQEVGLLPQRIPLRRATTSSTFIPFIKEQIPCKLPLHPP